MLSFLIILNQNIKMPFADRLFHEKEKYKAICDDLDSTFAELTGY